MQDYSDLEPWAIEQIPGEAFTDALFSGTTAVLARQAGSAQPLLGLALDLQPRKRLAELSLLFDPGVEDRSEVTSWDRHHASAESACTELWQPLRSSFEDELQRWRGLCQVDPKAGALYIYTMLQLFAFNLNSGSIADALDAVPAAVELEVFAVNVEDPTQPNAFQVEHGRRTLRDLSPPPARRVRRKESEPKVREPDPNQMRLF